MSAPWEALFMVFFMNKEERNFYNEGKEKSAMERPYTS